MCGLQELYTEMLVTSTQLQPFGLVCSNLTKRFGQVVALSDVNLQFPRSGIYSIVGPNGSGKSTLLKVLAGVVRQDRGRLILNGRDVSTATCLRRSRLGLSYVTQENRVFQQLTVRENLLMRTISAHSWRRLFWRKASLQSLGAQYFSFSEELVRFAHDLSYGRQRLLMIASAVAGGCRLLLLDEPAAGCDANTRQSLVAAILAIAAEETLVLVVEHDLRFVEALGGVTIFMQDGRVRFRKGDE
jgi:ABC-type branched-subunit amino acid transport system ATPase component